MQEQPQKTNRIIYAYENLMDYLTKEENKLDVNPT